MNWMTKQTIRNERDEFDRWFSTAFRDLEKLSGTYGGYPRVDAIEYGDKIVLEAELHGLEKGDVSVEINENVLTIRGGSRKQDAPERGRYLFREIKRSSFERSWTLDTSVDQTKVSATFENGKLTVTLPKVAEKKPSKIKVL